ncbi:PQQ-dependent sugar dehydrogenase [Streptomyces apocyni]|uniref:PQQ-dependent sugar dehydrogenase n=1 Tax=Streptomyces apocyni TaxID=2654677 RepID=UPI001E3F1B9B|nr:PQQ-dependent sugar dehydrogenase [Streptomyces apocyni]
MRRTAVAAVGVTTALLLAAGCTSDSDDGPVFPGKDDSAAPSGPSPSGVADQAPPATGSAKVVDTVTEDLESPWGLAPLPDGDLLVSSRDEGTITRVDGDSGRKTELGSVSGVDPGGEGGLMGLALSPSFASDRMVYAYFTTASDNRIARMRYDEERPDGRQLGEPSTVLRGIPKGINHNGGRIAFGPDKMLYAGTGETGDPDLAQDKESLGGKILRMTPDGQPAEGNPEADSVVYSYGHRNVQGLAWDKDKRLWASEFGQNTWDELNLIEAGENYGWPEVEGGATGDGGGGGEFTDPVVQWKPSEASPSGIAWADGSVWMAGLRGQRLWRVPLDGTEPVAKPQAFLADEYGRLRTVVSAGDGKLWVVTNETDSRGTPEEGDDRILLVEIE